MPPRQAVQVLDFRAGEIALLEVEDGRVWVTCDGLLEDYFLESGQRLSFTGPARLRVSAEGPRAARLLWARHPAGAGAAYPPAAAPTTQPLTVVPTTASAATAPSQRSPRGAISAA